MSRLMIDKLTIGYNFRLNPSTHTHSLSLSRTNGVEEDEKGKIEMQFALNVSRNIL